ncbi:MAG: hypothetical protein ACPKM1_15680 [Spirochaetaceae bacterium]
MRLYEPESLSYTPATYENTRKTGAVENYQHALNLTLMEDLPIVSRFIPSETKSRRDKLLLDYQKQGVISPQTAAWYDDDPDGMAYYARTQLGLTDIPTQEEYEAQLEEEYSAHRARAQQSYSQAGLAGHFGRLVGGLHAFSIDPLYATSFLTGYGTATTALQAAARVGLAEAGVEAAATPFKMEWHRTIGADYDGARYLADILFAGLPAGALAGLGKGLSNLAKRKAVKVGDVLTQLEQRAKEDSRLMGVYHVLKDADPDEKLEEVLRRDEGIDHLINSARPGPRTPDEFAEMTAKHRDSLREAEFERRVQTQALDIKDEPFEHIRMMDKDGKETYRGTDYERNSVSWPVSEGLRAHSTIHNHPSEVTTGFSAADLESTLDVGGNIMWVVNPDTTMFKMTVLQPEHFLHKVKPGKTKAATRNFLADVEKRYKALVDQEIAGIEPGDSQAWADLSTRAIMDTAGLPRWRDKIKYERIDDFFNPARMEKADLERLEFFRNRPAAFMSADEFKDFQALVEKYGNRRPDVEPKPKAAPDARTTPDTEIPEGARHLAPEDKLVAELDEQIKALEGCI